MFKNRSYPSLPNDRLLQERTLRLNQEAILWEQAYRPRNLWLSLMFVVAFVLLFITAGMYFLIYGSDSTKSLATILSGREIQLAELSETILPLCFILIPIWILLKLAHDIRVSRSSKLQISKSFLVHDLGNKKIAWSLKDVLLVEAVPLTKGRQQLIFNLSDINKQGENKTLDTVGIFDPSLIRSALSHSQVPLEIDPSLTIFEHDYESEMLAPGETVYWSERLGLGAIQRSHIMIFGLFGAVFSSFVFWVIHVWTYDGEKPAFWFPTSVLFSLLPIFLLGFPLLGAWIEIRKGFHDLVASIFGRTMITNQRIITTRPFRKEIYRAIRNDIVSDATLVKEGRFGGWIMVETCTSDNGSSEMLYNNIDLTGVKNANEALIAIQKMARL
ncbi:hypothetical protein [Sphingorhabdus sp. Alg231-15]|uniref:hypothetical protein n=1 Tax=Sphingorhabdus sp. Alg231-15 TaxID=1922222 RepID=UPI000D55A072